MIAAVTWPTPWRVQDSRGHQLDMLGQGALVVLQVRTEGADRGCESPCLDPCAGGGSTVALSGTPASVTVEN
jgi:hypothetical protein